MRVKNTFFYNSFRIYIYLEKNMMMKCFFEFQNKLKECRRQYFK